MYEFIMNKFTKFHFEQFKNRYPIIYIDIKDDIVLEESTYESLRSIEKR